MDIDHLSRLPIDMFIKNITYLSFEEVINVCKANTTLYNYCTNSKYNNQWRALIDDTFGNIYDYQEKLEQIRNKLNINGDVYNYLVYSHLVKLLDPITQLMIYYRQGDVKSFDDPQFTKIQRFLALFLLNKKDKMIDYLPDDDYLLFVSMLEGHKIDQDVMSGMLEEMATEGSVKGVSVMLSKGADIHTDNDALRFASIHGHLEVIKYLVEHGADIHAEDDYALRLAGLNGHLDILKYLVEHDADIHADDDAALGWASLKGHLEVIKYLVEQGADIHAQNDYSLIIASGKGQLDVVKYFVEHGADIHTTNDWPLKSARERGHLEVVKYLEDQMK